MYDFISYIVYVYLYDWWCKLWFLCIKSDMELYSKQNTIQLLKIQFNLKKMILLVLFGLEKALKFSTMHETSKR